MEDPDPNYLGYSRRWLITDSLTSSVFGFAQEVRSRADSVGL